MNRVFSQQIFRRGIQANVVALLIPVPLRSSYTRRLRARPFAFVFAFRICRTPSVFLPAFLVELGRNVLALFVRFSGEAEGRKSWEICMERRALLPDAYRHVQERVLSSHRTRFLLIYI